MQRRDIHPSRVEITHHAGCSIAQRNTGRPAVHLRAFARPRSGLRAHDLARHLAPSRDGVGHRLMPVAGQLVDVRIAPAGVRGIVQEAQDPSGQRIGLKSIQCRHVARGVNGLCGV